MITLPLGIMMTAVLILYSMGLDNIATYFNSHAVAIVAGGTATILLFSNPWFVLVNLVKDLKTLFVKQVHLKSVQQQLIQLGKNRGKDFNTKDELVDYAQDLWRQGVAHDLFIVLLSQKKQDIEQRSVGAIQSLKSLAKYPPALGMAGTVIGVVSLFQSLGNDKAKLGASLALAMTATFIGLVLANAIIMPLADRLQIKHIYQKQYLQNVYQILLLINQNEFSGLIEEEVKLRATS